MYVSKTDLGSYDVAYVLVEHGCDLEVLIDDKEEFCSETMLYKAINNEMSDAANFLIEKSVTFGIES